MSDLIRAVDRARFLGMDDEALRKEFETALNATKQEVAS